MTTPTLILTGPDLARLMTPADYLNAVTRGFRALAEGRIESPPPLHLHADGGGFHAKGAILSGGYAAVKINGNFPGNPEARGLPTIQGVLVLSDGNDGRVLAIMDSAEITLRRTAAATALAAATCARPPSSVAAVCGAGVQGRAQLEAVIAVLPIRKVRVWDQDPEKARRYAAEMAPALKLSITVAESVEAAVAHADVILACTSARKAYLHPEAVRSGTFIAAVGADHPEKSEIAPTLMAKADVVTDVTTQCAAMGDLHHAVAAGAMTAEDVMADLGTLLLERVEVTCGSGRIVVFDSTGVAAQDVASAAAIYERAREEGVGTRIQFPANPAGETVHDMNCPRSFTFNVIF